MRFGCSFATPSSALSVRCFAEKVQTEEQYENWRRRVRAKALRKKHQAKQRREERREEASSANPSVVPSADMAWRGEPWTRHRTTLRHCQSIHYSETQDQGFIDLTDGSDGAKRFTAMLECLLFEEEYVRKLAIRRIAFIHPQRRIAGADGVHSLTTEQQRNLCEDVKPYLESHETDPFRIVQLNRAWKKIRSQNQETDEPPERVCVCTMRDRVKQVITAWVMEPQCEACYAETNLFGHRPGRSAKELIDWLQTTLRGPPVSMAVFKAGVVSPEKVATFVDKYFPSYPFTGLRSWIESGLFELGMYPPGLGRHGEEQGCPILPILSNFLCHHLMKEVGDSVPSVHLASWYGNIIAMTHFSDEVFSDVQARLEEVADSVGLKAPMTTPVQPCHKDWVEFCEFSFCQEKIRPNDDDCSVVVRPREAVMERHLQNISTAFRLSDHFEEDKTGLINRLNPIVDSFSQHYAQTYAGDCFERADEHLRSLLIRWSSYENPSCTEDEAVAKEFESNHIRDLRFSFRTRIANLLRHGDALRNHSLPPVEKESSPYGDNSEYDYIFEWRDWEYHVTPQYTDMDVIRV